MAGVALAVIGKGQVWQPESIPNQRITLYPLHRFAADMNKTG